MRDLLLFGIMRASEWTGDYRKIVRSRVIPLILSILMFLLKEHIHIYVYTKYQQRITELYVFWFLFQFSTMNMYCLHKDKKWEIHCTITKKGKEKITMTVNFWALCFSTSYTLTHLILTATPEVATFTVPAHWTGDLTEAQARLYTPGINW